MTTRLTTDNLKQIIALKKQGKTNAQIAAHFRVHPQTVQTWITRLREKGHIVPNAKRKVFGAPATVLPEVEANN